MENIKYIPGDLVMTDGTPIGTKKGVAYIVTASDPSRTLTLENGTINKGVVTLDAISKEDKAHFVETSTWVKHVVPIPLTIDILEKNGWKRHKSVLFDTYLKNVYTIIEYTKEKGDFYVCIGRNNLVIRKVQYVHQLQHLLFGLGFPMDLKVEI